MKIASILFMLLLVTPAKAELISFDFNQGPGPNFDLINPSGLFSIEGDGPSLRITKGSDVGSVSPTNQVMAGAASLFSLNGDFSVTVDFTLNVFPFPSANQQINSSLLAVSDDGNMLAEVLRFRLNGRDRAELFASVPFQDLPINTSATTGRYRLVRQGTTVTAFFAEGNGAFIPLADAFGVTGPVQVHLLAAQTPNVVGGARPTTALDVEFDNLVIEADEITGLVAVPEPVSGLAWIGATIFLLVSRFSRSVPAMSRPLGENH
jgi:hypothetical protein